MLIDDFIINIFCLIDDEYDVIIKNRLRISGPNPKLKDSEVITMEIVGEFLGMDTDTSIHSYFKRHWTDFFPAIGDHGRLIKIKSDFRDK
ncbi:MAG: hypothetical protein HQK51_21165 [Oligoflexia bacterium]|nr:hypothetical protein [Oligoflexia bacterium]